MNDSLYNLIERQKNERAIIVKDSSVKREGFAALKRSLSKKLIKAVIGPRRSGKSSLVHQVLSSTGQDYGYVNFEDEQLPIECGFDDIEKGLARAYPNATVFFFDEIQVFPRWEQLLNRLERTGRRIVVSGSNSKLLSSELSSSLTGRHEVFENLPFSFREYCQIYSQKIIDAEVLKEYLVSGGFPDVVLNRVMPSDYLRGLWDSIILKDVVQRYSVRSIAELKGVLTIFRDSMSSSVSHRSLERAMQSRISIATIGKFLSYAEGAYLGFLLQNFSFKSRQRVNADKKAYLIDNGFYTSMRIGSQDDHGKLLENFIFITLMRKGLKPNLDFFYYKTRSGYEVDFLILNTGKPSSLIQVCWSLGSASTVEREIRALSEALVETKASSATIVTFNERASYQNNTVRSIPVIDFINATDWGG